MRLRILTAAAAVLLLQASPQTVKADPLNAGGVGMATCFVIMERIIRNVSYADSVAEWVAGYVSGANVVHIAANGWYRDATALLGSGPDHIVRTLIRHCRAAPRQLVIAVVEEIYVSLPPKNWQR